MSEKHYPYYGGAFDRIVFDKDGSVWVPESEISKLRYLESENASLRGAAQGLGELCDDYKSENAKLRELGPVITGETSDGYHTFNELYHHRAVLFSVIVHDHGDLAWKSKKHYDGTMYDGMFIVGIETPEGQATYHYDIDPYWDMFECKEVDRAPEWDGHTPDDAIARIATLCVSDATLARQGDADLKAENAKLRELVEVLVNCGRKYHTMSGSCPMFDADAEADDFCGAVQAARELGIEVDA